MNSYESYATVIGDRTRRNPMALAVAARTGAVVVMTSLTAQITDYEGARREAQGHYPDRLIVIPHLGEQTPPVTR